MLTSKAALNRLLENGSFKNRNYSVTASGTDLFLQTEMKGLENIPQEGWIMLDGMSCRFDVNCLLIRFQNLEEFRSFKDKYGVNSLVFPEDSKVFFKTIWDNNVRQIEALETQNVKLGKRYRLANQMVQLVSYDD